MAVKPSFSGMRGYVDVIECYEGKMTITGWAVQHTGQVAMLIRVVLGETFVVFHDFTRLSRTDVQGMHSLPHAMVGFRVELFFPSGTPAVPLGELVQVYAGTTLGEREFRLPLSPAATVATVAG